ALGLGAEAGEPLGATIEDVRHLADRLDVVPDGRRAERTLDGRERWLELRPAFLAFEGRDEPGLLAADVGARAPVHDDVEAVAEVFRLVGLAHRRGEPAPGLDVLAADVDEGGRRADGARRDEHALDERVRVALEQVAILEGSRLALVGVDHQVDGAGVGLRDERPLGPRREPGAAEAAEVRALDLLQDRGGLHRLRLRPRLVTARLAIDRKGVRVGAREVPGEDRLAAHARPSRIWSTFADVRLS